MDFPTRSEKREALLIQSAERGEFSRRDCLYLAEIRKLEKDGFTVHVSSPFDETGSCLMLQFLGEMRTKMLFRI